MHLLTLLTASSVLVTSAAAVDLTPSMDLSNTLGKPVNSKRQWERTWPKEWDRPKCNADFPAMDHELEPLILLKEEVANEFNARRKWGLAPGVHVGTAPGKCISLLGVIRNKYGINAYACNDNDHSIDLSEDDIWMAMELAEEVCHKSTQKAIQIFNNKRNWNLIMRGVPVIEDEGKSKAKRQPFTA